MVTDTFFKYGRMISGSKSDYSRRHPDNKVYFNANVCTKSKGKIWYGDLDLTLDGEKLIEFAQNIGEELFILREMDGRFENEGNPKLDKAIARVTATSGIIYASST